MAKWKEIVGKNFTIEEFKDYADTLKWTDWIPNFIVLHNTGVPNLSSYPDGITHRYINVILPNYYKNTLGWSAGPHLFVDDKQIWVFTPPTTNGVHSPSWNRIAIGVEMLGDYNIEQFNSGRGAKVRDNTVAAIAILTDALGIDPHTMRLHKEDPGTDHDCPGKNVDKAKFIGMVKKYVVWPVVVPPPIPELPMIEPVVIPDKVVGPPLVQKLNWWEAFLKNLRRKK